MYYEYAIWFSIALVGAMLKAAIYLKGQKKRAEDNNVENVSFNIFHYLKEDQFAVIISLLSIILALLLTAPILKLYPNAMDYMRFGYAFVGYFSQDIANQFFGAIKKRVDQVIDRKTTVADELLKEKGQDPITK